MTYYYRFQAPRGKVRYATNVGEYPGESLGDIQRWAIDKYGDVTDLCQVEPHVIPMRATVERGWDRHRR